MICILQVFQSHELTNFNHWQMAGDHKKVILLFAGTAWLRSCRFLLHQLVHGNKAHKVIGNTDTLPPFAAALVPDGIGVGLEINRTARVFPPFQNVNNGIGVPVVRISGFRTWGANALSPFIGSRVEHLFRL